MIFVDSSVWIDYFNGRISPETDRLDELLGREPVCTGDLVLLEVLQGFRRDRDFRLARELMSSLTLFELGGAGRAVRSAQNYRRLRRRGITIRKSVDLLIATFCLEQELPLLHSDRDFEPFHRHLGLARAL